MKTKIKSPVGFTPFSLSDIHLYHPLDSSFALYEDLASPESKSDPNHNFLNADKYLYRFVKSTDNPWKIDGLIRFIEYACAHLLAIYQKNPRSFRPFLDLNNWLIFEERISRINQRVNMLAMLCEQENKRVFSKRATQAEFTARKYAKRIIKTILLNRCAFKYPGEANQPSYVKECKRLPPLSKRTWKEWASVARKIIHADAPDIIEQPGWDNHKRRATAVIGVCKTERKDHKIDGRMRGQIIDDICKAIKALAPSIPA